ncbi:ABC transporter substrate-binding protein [Lapidilactobacillus bayanensis]|uniref:ABC transporter substrate-binding protein n=1 Tax=Lapidilactobacillus bayanensis TaxID=2485998 RepID=UPI000F7732D5|nr:sugar ABC transporter substrate-binding protein [Lapidilactobacillus bayanensis]
MNKRKVLGVLGITVLTSLVLAGCSSKSKADGKDVTMWVQYSKTDPEGKAMAKNITAFNKENKKGYHATVQYIPRNSSGGGYEDKVNAALNAGNLPDVLTLDGPNTAAYAKNKIIQPLDKYITNKSDILPSIISQGTYKGKLYSIGYSESGVGIYYNKRMFKDAGIQESSIPTLKNPWDWNQFMAICAKLKAKYNAPAIDMQIQDHSEMSLYAFAPFVWSAGGNITNKNGTKSIGYFNSKESQTAFQFIQDMVKKDYTTTTPVNKAFQTGKYPMMLSGSWTITELNTSYKHLDYGMLPYPVSPMTHKLVSPTGSWQYAMTTSTTKKKAAGALVNFLSSTKQEYRTSMTMSTLPARKSVSKLMEDKVDPSLRFLMEQNILSGHARPVLVNYPQVTRTFADTVTKTTYYKQNPNIAKLLKKQATTIQSYLK